MPGDCRSGFIFSVDGISWQIIGGKGQFVQLHVAGGRGFVAHSSLEYVDLVACSCFHGNLPALIVPQMSFFKVSLCPLCLMYQCGYPVFPGYICKSTYLNG